MSEPNSPPSDEPPPGDASPDPTAGPRRASPEEAALLRSYWRANIRIMIALLVVWAAAGLGCGVLFADALNHVRLGGYPLGFWFAQQGSIVVFVLIILVYALALNRLDAKHHRELEALKRGRRAGVEA